LKAPLTTGFYRPIKRVKLVVWVRSLYAGSLFQNGDGMKPLCAAALCLHIPPQFHWRYVSIDPLMETHDLVLGVYSPCLEVVKGYSQDYQIPPTVASLPDPPLSIVIACHSHAPVSEFWNRLSTPKIAITMACCADYAELPGVEPKLKDNRLLKHLISSAWGHINANNKIYISWEDIEREGLDIGTSDEHEYKILKYNDEHDRECYELLLNTKSSYKYNIRVKPWITAHYH
jgi:hypothetical protein